MKASNESEDDWSDIAAMLEVMGENRTNLFTTERARAAVNVEQWMTHLAVMNTITAATIARAVDHLKR